MPTSCELERLRHAPLEDVLLKLYPVMPLRWLYDVSLRALAQACPAALPQPEPSKKRAGADNVPKKTYLISLLLAVLRDPAMGRRFFDSLPQATRDALAALTWEPSINLAALEQRLGLQLAAVHPNERRWYYEPFFLSPEHGLLVIQKTAENYWSYYSDRNHPPKKEGYCVLLPDALRSAFKAFVPPPPGYELQPVETLPATAPTRYNCAPKALADLRLVAEYIAQGHLKYTKSERVALPSLKALHQITGGPEFFENPPDAELALLRTRLLVGGLAGAGQKEREKLLAHPDRAEPVRELVEKVLASASFLHEELLGHLPRSRNRWCSYSAHAVKHLAAFFGKFPAGQWIAFENMRRYHALREEVPSLFAQEPGGLVASVTKTSDQWSTSVSVSQHNAFELVSEPLLKGYAFLLAAFGLAEIAYDLPQHPAYHRPKLACLTPYDGLAFARLTPLGEFVFRRRDTCDVTAAAPARSPILLDQTRLLATCRNPDALTELALGQFFDKLAPGRYRMSPKSLLGGCASRQDLEERLRLFRRVVSAAPPPIWEEFFQKTLARIAPLSLEAGYLVLKVSADEDIRRLLATDPLLRELALKVEGLRLAVRHSDLKKLAKRLEQFGYLSPLPQLP